MPRQKEYKFLGPWLRKLRVSKGIDRSWLAKKMSRTTANLTSMETGNQKIPNMSVVRSWLTHLGCLDKIEIAKRLFMVDGNRLEVSIATLNLDDRLRLIAIYNFLIDKGFKDHIREFVDKCLFQEIVTVTRKKTPGMKPKEGELAVVTEFDYKHSSQEVIEVREYSYEDIKNGNKQ